MRFPQYGSIASAVLVCLTLSLCAAGGNQKDQPSSSSKVLDSGIFAVYVKGKRVAQEKFEITQSPDLSVAKAELRMEEAKNPQIAELRLLPNGNLQRYTWSEKDQGNAVVEPKDEFLIEKITLTSPAKSAEQPFLMPVSTLILDDYFFSQRQILLWRYLAAQCRPKPGEPGCQLTPTQFGVIVPRAQTSAQVTVEYVGQQKVSMKGTDRELARFEMKMEGNDWTLWVDEAYKIQKISIAGEQAEVYRE
jgi:hypothetical protein